MEYNEDDAVEAMRSALSPEKAKSYTDDELLGIIDIIWDWYEENGLLDIKVDDEDEDGEASESELVSHVAKLLKKDKNGIIQPEDAETLVKAELNYEKSLED